MAHLDRFHYQILGNESGPKLVFLHGLLGSGANWRKIASAFEKDYHILVYDQRGHGRSQHAEDGCDVQRFAEDLAGILDQLRWSKISLVGHSLGGRVALCFTDRWPQRVSALVIEDIGPEPNPAVAEYLRRVFSLLPPEFSSREQARTYFSNEFPMRLVEEDGSGAPAKGELAEAQVMGQFLMTNLIEREGHWVWRFDQSALKEILASGLEADRWREWQGLKVPTLLIRGERSRDLPPAVFLAMKTRLPGVQAVEIRESGHWVHFDQPAEFISTLKNFLASVL